jgi:hypothetical protein
MGFLFEILVWISVGIFDVIFVGIFVLLPHYKGEGNKIKSRLQRIQI